MWKIIELEEQTGFVIEINTLRSFVLHFLHKIYEITMEITTNNT